jgi:hypothetical protein
MADKRMVHDILSESGTGPNGETLQRRPVSFIQHGNPEDGFTYEGICPWCGTTLCYVKQEQTKVIGGLYRILLSQQKIHWTQCEMFPKLSKLLPNQKMEMAVEVADKPLGTEKPFTVQ